jgi:biopolymer transport protein ExbB
MRTCLIAFVLAAALAAAGETQAPAKSAAPPAPTSAASAQPSSAMPAEGRLAEPEQLAEGSILGKNFWETFRAGGFLMWPILLCSIVGLAFAIERALSLRQKAVMPKGVAEAVLAAASHGGIDEARRLCQERPSSLTRVLGAGLAAADQPREEMLDAMEGASEREQWSMDRFNRPLTIITSVAPLLGLLGTVQGMIMAFDVVARKGAMGDPRQLAAGVATALLTTFAGLTVAIPCYCFYHYYRDKADRMLLQIEDAGAHLAHALKGNPAHADPPPTR